MEKRKGRPDIESTQVNPIKYYHAPDKPAFHQIVLHPVAEVQFKESFINLFCSCSCSFLEKRTSWSGYISVNADCQPLEKSVVIMLLMINLYITSITALHSLLCFVVEQSKNNKLSTVSITSDQPLYVKTCEIVMSHKTEVFVRLGDFHQLKSFLGSIGSLMEGSGLRRPLETVRLP